MSRTLRGQRDGVAWLFSVFYLAGCAPVFSGEATTNVNDCVRWCAQNSMRVAGMVRHGTYGTSCVCEVPRAGRSSAVLRSAAALAPLVAGAGQ